MFMILMPTLLLGGDGLVSQFAIVAVGILPLRRSGRMGPRRIWQKSHRAHLDRCPIIGWP